MGGVHVIEPRPPPPVDIDEELTLSNESFEQFFRREYARIVALVVAVSGDREAAEDVAQEALWRAHQRWARIAAYDKPGAWVRRVALNLASNARDRRRTERAALDRLGRRRPPVAPGEPEVAEFWATVCRLPTRQAAAVALHYLEDRPVAEVAEILDCAEGTAKAHLHKGRANLARLLHDPRNEDQ